MHLQLPAPGHLGQRLVLLDLLLLLDLIRQELREGFVPCPRDEKREREREIMSPPGDSPGTPPPPLHVQPGRVSSLPGVPSRCPRPLSPLTLRVEAAAAAGDAAGRAPVRAEQRGPAPAAPQLPEGAGRGRGRGRERGAGPGGTGRERGRQQRARSGEGGGGGAQGPCEQHGGDRHGEKGKGKGRRRPRNWKRGPRFETAPGESGGKRGK